MRRRGRRSKRGCTGWWVDANTIARTHDVPHARGSDHDGRVGRDDREVAIRPPVARRAREREAVAQWPRAATLAYMSEFGAHGGRVSDRAVPADAAGRALPDRGRRR